MNCIFKIHSPAGEAHIFEKINDFQDTFDPIESGNAVLRADTMLIRIHQGQDTVGTYHEDMKTIELHKSIKEAAASIAKELRSEK